MSRHRSPLRDRAAFGELPPDLYVVPGAWPRLGRSVKHDVESWRVVDDWPVHVPVTDAEVEAHVASKAAISASVKSERVSTWRSCRLRR